MIRCALPDSLTRAVSTPLRLEHVELGEQHRGVDDDAVADHRDDVRVEHAARHELEREHLAVDDDACGPAL